MIGILCPSSFEYKTLDRARLRKAGCDIEVSGMGKVRSLLGALRLSEKNPGLRGILLIGYAGGLTTDLSIGDVVEPDIFIEQDYYAEPFEKFPNRIDLKKKEKLVSSSRRAAMLTQDRFLTENPYKSGKLAHEHGTIACDMESYAVAKFCIEKKIRFSAVKLISDVANENADHDFLSACKKLAPKLSRTVLAAVKAFIFILCLSGGIAYAAENDQVPGIEMKQGQYTDTEGAEKAKKLEGRYEAAKSDFGKAFGITQDKSSEIKDTSDGTTATAGS